MVKVDQDENGLGNKSISNLSDNIKELCNGILKDKRYWFDIAEEDFPFVIAHEYWRIRDLLQNGQIFGCYQQIKDLFEVLIKFPVLLAVSQLYHKPERSDQDIELFLMLIEKPISLGHWEVIAKHILDKCEIHPIIAKILAEILNMFKKYQIVNWRNKNFGHGALALESDQRFQKDLKEKLTIIKNVLQPLNGEFTSIELIQNNDKNCILKGKDSLKQSKKGDIINASIQGVSLNLYPFIFIIDTGFFFFDSYLKYKEKMDILNYPEGKKESKKEKELVELYNQVSNLLNNLNNDQFNQEENITYHEQEILEKIQDINDFVVPKNVVSWVTKLIKTKEKGLFLLQMEEGAGKSTLVRYLDEQSMNVYSCDEFSGFSVRAIYLNSAYNLQTERFLEEMNYKMFEGKDRGQRISAPAIKRLAFDAAEKKKDFAKFLDECFWEHKNQFGSEKLILILDGVDEIINGTVSIYDFIPDEQYLTQGVYILVTSRTDKELSSFSKHKLLEFNFTEKKVFQNKDFEDLHKEYIQRYFKNIAPQFKKSNMTIKKLRMIKEIVGVSHPEMDINDLLLDDNKLLEAYLFKLENFYGQKHFTNIRRILALLAISYEPLTVKEIGLLLGEEIGNSRLIGHLADLRGLLTIEKTNRGNLFSISNPTWKNKIVHVYTNEITNLLNEWMELVNNFDNLKLSLNRREFYSYIQGYIWFYAIDYLNLKDNELLMLIPLISNGMGKIVSDGELPNYQRFRFLYSVSDIANYLEAFIDFLFSLKDQQFPMELMKEMHIDLIETYHFKTKLLWSLSNYQQALKENNRALELAAYTFENLLDSGSSDFIYLHHLNMKIFETNLDLSVETRNYDNVLFIGNYLLDVYESSEDTEKTLLKKIHVLNSIGICKDKLGLTEEALRYYQEAISLVESTSLNIDKKTIVSSLINNIALATFDSNKALELINSFDADSSDNYLRAKNYLNKASISLRFFRYEDARNYIDQAIPLFEEFYFSDFQIDLLDLIKAYYVKANILKVFQQEESLYFVNKTVDLINELDEANYELNLPFISEIYYQRGQLFSALKNFPSAINDFSFVIDLARFNLNETSNYFIKSLDKRLNIYRFLNDLESALCDCNTLINHYENLFFEKKNQIAIFSLSNYLYVRIELLLKIGDLHEANNYCWELVNLTEYYLDKEKDIIDMYLKAVLLFLKLSVRLDLREDFFEILNRYIATLKNLNLEIPDHCMEIKAGIDRFLAHFQK